MTTINEWRHEHAVSTGVSIHINEHVEFDGVVRQHDNGEPYVVLRIDGPHGKIDIFIDDAEVLSRFMATANEAFQEFMNQLFGVTKAGVAA